MRQIRKVKSISDPSQHGSPAWYAAQYAYAPTKVDTFFRTMGFGGTAPEAVNGRAAMLAFVALLGEEMANGKSLGAQVADQYVGVAAVFALVTMASLVPLARGVEVSHADLGPFKSGVEKLHGRLAMVAFAYLALGESFGDKTMAKDRVGGALVAARDQALSLDWKAFLFFGALAAMLGVVTAGATFGGFQLADLVADNEDD